MTRKILAVIPARGGSKGLPRKNIIDLAGKPLVGWTIDASLNSNYITKTVVSSEDAEILDVSVKMGADIVYRPPELATDYSSSEAVMEHAIVSLDEKFDYAVLLQPTSPLRTEVDIDCAFEKIFASDATALISVIRVDNKILKAFVQNSSGYIEGIKNNRYPFTPRQKLPETYISNGAIYIIRTEQFYKNKAFFTEKTIHYEMNHVSSIDIDSKEDLMEAQRHLGK